MLQWGDAARLASGWASRLIEPWMELYTTAMVGIYPAAAAACFSFAITIVLPLSVHLYRYCCDTTVLHHFEGACD